VRLYPGPFPSASARRMPYAATFSVAFGIVCDWHRLWTGLNMTISLLSRTISLIGQMSMRKCEFHAVLCGFHANCANSIEGCCRAMLTVHGIAQPIPEQSHVVFSEAIRWTRAAFWRAPLRRGRGATAPAERSPPKRTELESPNTYDTRATCDLPPGPSGGALQRRSKVR
jgi:hypothetical protein